MGRLALKWVALCLWMVPAWSSAQPGTDLDRDVQRAILLGKAGEFARGLEAVEAHLGQDSRHAEAWFMSGFLLKEWYKQSDNRAHRQEAMQRLATSLDLHSAQGRPANWLPQARRALGYLGDDCYDDAVAAVNTFQAGEEANVLALVDQYAMAVQALKPGPTSRQSGPPSTKTWPTPTPRCTRPPPTRCTLRASKRITERRWR